MKKFLVILLVLFGLYQSWDDIEQLFADEPAASAHGEVILYATSWCGYCAQTRELLAAQNVSYKEYDIEKSDAGRKRYEELDGNGVPVLDIKGTIIHGYDEDGILEALQ